MQFLENYLQVKDGAKIDFLQSFFKLQANQSLGLAKDLTFFVNEMPKQNLGLRFEFNSASDLNQIIISICPIKNTAILINHWNLDENGKLPLNQKALVLSLDFLHFIVRWWIEIKNTTLPNSTGDLEFNNLPFKLGKELKESLLFSIDKQIQILKAGTYKYYAEQQYASEQVAALETEIKNLQGTTYLYNLTAKVNAIRDLAQSRALLIREQTELSFLEKIQAADSLEALQSLENELNNTPTDPELIKRLLKYTADKKAFY